MGKKVYILRGVPGCGKTYWVHFNSHRLNFDHRENVCSADHSFEIDGEYHFDPALLGQAHAICFGKFIRLIGDKAPIIVVDNTNIHRWEFSNYSCLAYLHGYDVVEVNLMPKTLDDLRACVRRNTHGVPPEVIAKMALEFEK